MCGIYNFENPARGPFATLSTILHWRDACGRWLVKNISAHAHTAAPIRTCGCGVRCRFFGIFNVRVGCSAKGLKMPSHPHFNSGKNLGKSMNNFPNFSKKVLPHPTVPHNSLKKFLRTTPHPSSLFFFRTNTAMQIRLPLNTCFLKEF